MDEIMKPLKLHYYRYIKNFGDLLSPIIIEKLSHRSVEYSELYDADIIALGSLLQHMAHPQIAKGVIWGSGMMAGKLPAFFDRWAIHPNQVCALRGALTRDFWKLPENIPLGDPALLLPCIWDYFPKKTVSNNDFIVIPHFQHIKYFSPLIDKSNSRSEIVNPINNPKFVVDKILTSKCVYASSLHALIVADAYGIPSAWIMPEPLLHSPMFQFIRFKYDDYYSTFGIKRNPIFIPNDADDNYFYSLQSALYAPPPKNDIRFIQNGLLKSFPFGDMQCG